MSIQNIYDNPVFFAGYKELRRTESGLNAALEQPALRRLLPVSLNDLCVLDLGCGFGDFARYSRQLGAQQVVGVDVSARMLDIARQQTIDPSIIYQQVAIEDFQWHGRPFDLVVSSLALHYVQDDYRKVLSQLSRCMTHGAQLIFSVEHPMSTAREEQEWHLSANGEKLHWPVDHYLEEGERHTSWFVDGVIKYHRTVETYVNGLLETGFRLTRLEEPAPTAQALVERPELSLQLRRPPFLLLAATWQG